MDEVIEMKFKDRVIVITGGVNGIGKAITEAFNQEGAKTVVIDKDESDLSCDFFFLGDLAEESVLIEFSETVIKRYGRIDYLINNACINKKGILTDCSFDDFNYVLKVGVTAPYILTKLFKGFFTEQGVIINLSSTRAFMSQPDTESYSAAKGGITALTHALAISLQGKVRVNAIAPGWIDTTNQNWSIPDSLQHPVKRIGNTQDIVHLIKFLCSEESSFMNGEIITVDGGMSKLMIYHNDHGWKFGNNN
jgi:NAD(P)-dependent dehydrogenase (short-subunit alcohol dehydrogenase family)